VRTPFTLMRFYHVRRTHSWDTGYSICCPVIIDLFCRVYVGTIWFVQVLPSSTTLALSSERSADLSAAVWASEGRSAGPGDDDGFSYGRQRRLRRAGRDSFFPRSRRRGEDAGGRRRRSWPSARGYEDLEAIEFCERNLRLGPRRAIVGGHASALESSFVASPGLRQEPAGPPSPGPRRAPGLATPRFGNSPSCPKPTHIEATPTECVPFFGNAVSSMTRKASAPQLVRLDRKLTPQRSLVPDAIRHEMVQSVVIARRDTLGHRADALAIARPDQPRHIERTHPPPRLVADPLHERRQPPPELLPPPAMSRAPKSERESSPQRG
jgi:hypothetical protein